ncbi:SpoIID/LytB domain-containing protein [candidate division KSB1 bacterium]|nr:SpoIID/LytB domain-containing protein [candidate division KSB1 bacterium]
MDMTEHQSSPKVRIGVIQSTDSVEFHVNQNYELIDHAGQLVKAGQRNKKSRIEIESSQPAKIAYQIRLGKIALKADADSFLAAVKAKHIAASARHIGEVLSFRDRTVDNREYWITTGNYATYEEAIEAQQEFSDFEDNSIVEKLITNPSGTLRLDGVPLRNRVRIIPGKLVESRITIQNVIVGIEFHWQRLEAQEYRGIIEIAFNNEGKLSVINEIDMEEYLISVNSSEMTPDCPMDLLKAQTIAARSTILATMGKHHYSQPFHLCADDHCQCYRGTTYESATSVQAVRETAGETLFFGNQVCDARYAKICGGVMESYENVWEKKQIPYLRAGIDGDLEIELPLNTEEKARKFIDSNLPAYCNTDMYELPKMLEYSNHLFRWRVTHRREELQDIIRSRSNEDIGQLLNIVPLKRGVSGRLMQIEIIGTKRRLTITRELAIRRILSRSHLYSSCFYIEKALAEDGTIDAITFVGAGWGHGVGLCQVGATIMAKKGFTYPQILAHYYKDANLVKLYE